jgi:hypothetical protein
MERTTLTATRSSTCSFLSARTTGWVWSSLAAHTCLLCERFSECWSLFALLGRGCRSRTGTSSVQIMPSRALFDAEDVWISGFHF